MLPNCFVLERKHKWPKRFATETRNLQGNWDSHVLQEVTAHHISVLEHARFGISQVCLIDGYGPSKQFLEKLSTLLFWDPATTTISTSRTARINEFETCGKGDVVVYSDELGNESVGQIEFHVSAAHGVEEYTYSFVHVWAIESSDTRAWKCRRSENRVLIRTETIAAALVWGGAEGIVTVIKPTHV